MLVKKRVDEYVLKDALEGASIPEHVRRLLLTEFVDVKVASEALKAFKKCMPTGGDDDLIVDELKEIIKDIKWSLTPKGKLVIQCNDSIPLLYKTIKEKWGLGDVVIGAHAEKLAVIVAGKVKSSADRDRVVTLIKKSFACEVIDSISVSN